MYLDVANFQMAFFFIKHKFCRGLFEKNLWWFVRDTKNIQFIYDKRMRAVFSVEFRIMRSHLEFIIFEREFN